MEPQVVVQPAENVPRASLPLVGRVPAGGWGWQRAPCILIPCADQTMPLRLLTPTEIEANWPRLCALLAPAIAHDERRTLADVYTELIARTLHCLSVEATGTSGLAILQFGTSTGGASCCWVVYVAGRVTGAPRRWRQSVGDLMRHFESIARSCGSTEMRVEGRNWAKILNDYEALSDRPGRNELRKVL
jgi:hypothetical protein